MGSISAASIIWYQEGATIRAASRHLRRCRYLCTNRRTYHSYDHSSTVKSSGFVEHAILSAAYKHVPQHGFSQRALGLGARDSGYLDISPSVLSDGLFSLIRYHLITQRQSLAPKCAQIFSQDDPQRSIGGRVTALTWERLKANGDIVHQWQEALAIMAQPSYLTDSLKELAKLSDEIWFLAGDTAVDPSWYTKRATLSIVYTSSELFMTTDQSPDFIETQNFLKKRLDEVQGVSDMIGTVTQWASFTANTSINVLRSKGIPI